MSSCVPRSLRGGLAVFALAVAIFVLAAPGALGRAGDPDLSFGTGGRTVADVSPFATAIATSMATDPQGRILVAGYYVRFFGSYTVLARFNPDGSLDRSFGKEGVVTPLWGGRVAITSVAVDRAGRVVLGGTYLASAKIYPPEGNDLAVARLLGNGEPDGSFSEDGFLRLDEGTGSDLALDDEGRILLAGSIAGGPAIVRLTDTGILDPGFGEDGVAGVPFGGPSVAEAVTVDPQGRIVLAGSVNLDDDGDFAVARLDTGGRPDPSFDGDGMVTLDFDASPAGEAATDVALDGLGRLVLVGTTSTSTSRVALAARLLPDGFPDPSFDADGWLALGMRGSVAAEGLAIDASGRILVTGSLREGEDKESGRLDIEEAFLARLGSEGLLDPSFGAGGVIRENYGRASFAAASAVVVDAAGRYLIAGQVWGAGGKGFALARYLSADQRQVAAVRRCRGKRVSIVGTRGRDRLRGTGERDVIVALGGNDRIRGLGGRDLICAGDGRDFVRAGAGNDKVYGGRGNDRLFGGPGRDLLRGGPGGDHAR